MRASERKGAWALMTGIVMLGFMVWILGKCSNARDSASFNGKDGPSEVEMRQLPSESIEDSSNGHGRRIKNRKKRSGEAEKGGVKKNKKGKQAKHRIPVRDILADTITTE